MTTKNRKNRFLPTLEALEARLTPSTITHRGLTPILGSAPVAVVTSPTHAANVPAPGQSIGPVVRPLGPQPPNNNDIWLNRDANGQWSDANNWSLNEVPGTTNMLPAVFDGTNGSNTTCTTDVAPNNGTAVNFRNGFTGNFNITAGCSLGTISSSVSTALNASAIMTVNAAVSCSGLNITAGSWFAGNNTLTYTGTSANGSISIPLGQQLILAMSTFKIAAGAALNMHGGNTILGDPNTGSTTIVTVLGTLTLDNGNGLLGRFKTTSTASQVQLGDATNGGGTLTLTNSANWESYVTVWLRGNASAGGNQFKILDSCTFDFKGTTFTAATGELTCLREEQGAQQFNKVSLADSATLNLYGFAILSDRLETLQGTNSTVWIGSNGGTNGNTVAQIDFTRQGNGGPTASLYFWGNDRLACNVNVFTAGLFFYGSVDYLGNNNWSRSYWSFGNSNTLTLANGTQDTIDFNESGTNMPNPYGANVSIITVPGGIQGTGQVAPGAAWNNMNGWGVAKVGNNCELTHP
jgi:hypothetical protein